MKTEIATTKEQSRRLLACGVSPDTADMCWTRFESDGEKYEQLSVMDESTYEFASLSPIPAWSLSALLGLLPKEIVTDTIMCDDDVCPISIRWDTNCQKWFVGYDLIPHPVGVGVDSELIDALFSTLCWVIEKNFLTK